MAVEDDDQKLATRGQVRLLRREVKYWVIIGLIGGQTLSQIALSYLSRDDILNAAAFYLFSTPALAASGLTALVL